MPVEPTDEGRLSIPGEISMLALLGGALKSDARLRDQGAEVELVERVIEVRRPDALVVIARVAELSELPLVPYLERIAEGRAGVVLVGRSSAELSKEMPPSVMLTCLEDGCSSEALYRAAEGLLHRLELRQHDERKARWIKRYRYELGELVEIARAITQERDLSRLLNVILEKSRFITGADAGSIYVLETNPARPSDRLLRFKTSQNESVAFESSEFTMPVSTRSIAGAAVVRRTTINIPDVDAISADAPYGFDRSFDEKVGYRTRSMIAVPMISAEDEVIGVIQLINKKREPEEQLRTPADFENEVIAFDDRSAELLETLASQAGIALENALLYDEIQRIFEGFVRASVQAIEARDPTTSGHSLRVSVLSCRLAEIVDRVDNGPYATSTFTRREMKELEYAALLHDFGKIGVREQVLVKAKKLYPHELDLVRARFAYLREAATARSLAKKLDAVRAGAGQSDLDTIDAALAVERDELDKALAVILQANEPTVLTEGDFTAIASLAERTYTDSDGCTLPLLSSSEVESLQVMRGSLRPSEMGEIRSHVVHTFDFLSRIPWGKTMARIPIIAGAHHEKLNGTGYPNRVIADSIPVQARIMTIADIYDALTARDRPYKKAMPVGRALDILGYEVRDGNIDPELVRLFAEARVYDAVAEKLEY
jgi:HD-GYP domain-containing protein (c-di-GMP phosphodiesterase class II)